MNLSYMMKVKIKISAICLLLLTSSSCNYLKKKKAIQKMEKEYTEYQDLHKHQGTENYDVITLFNEHSVIEEKLAEQKQLFLSVIGKEKEKSKRIKVDFFGNLLGIGLSSETLIDGTMSGYKTYGNWLINNDTTLNKYIDPFLNKEIKDPLDYNFKNVEKREWLQKFKELYLDASYVHIDSYDYYFKIKERWYLIQTYKKAKELNIDIKKQYPSKINPEEIRMVKIPEVFDNLLENKTLQLAEYVEMDKQKSSGLNPISFSSGYYMFELHLPQGDILKFRRYGAMGFNADMNIYQIPKELGGSDEVFFIEQLPRQTYPDKSFAGFYAIRPKNYKELPEYKSYSEKEKKN